MSHLRSHSQRSRTPTALASSSTSDLSLSGAAEPNKKSQRRKSYTLAKKRVYWTQDEHERFLKALEKYGREWKKVEEIVGTKSSVQIRSHAQKYFLKASREDKSFELPPAKIRQDFGQSSNSPSEFRADVCSPKHVSRSSSHSPIQSSTDSDSSPRHTYSPLQQPRTNAGHARSASEIKSDQKRFSPLRDMHRAQENMTPPLRPKNAPMDIDMDPLLVLHEMALGCLGSTSASTSVDELDSASASTSVDEREETLVCNQRLEGPNILRRKRSVVNHDAEPRRLRPFPPARVAVEAQTSTARPEPAVEVQTSSSSAQPAQDIVEAHQMGNSSAGPWSTELGGRLQPKLIVVHKPADLDEAAVSALRALDSLADQAQTSTLPSANTSKRMRTSGYDTPPASPASLGASPCSQAATPAVLNTPISMMPSSPLIMPEMSLVLPPAASTTPELIKSTSLQRVEAPLPGPSTSQPSLPFSAQLELMFGAVPDRLVL